MSNSADRPFARMLAARERVIAVRTARTASLMRYRDYLRAAYAEFASNVDPITGSRFAEVSADGSKARGDLEISVNFFEGTKLSIGIDAYGRFVRSANPPRVLGDIDAIVAIEIADDLSSARLTYDTSTQPVRRRTIDVAQLLHVVTDAALKAVEADVVEETAPPVSAPPASEPQIGTLAVAVVPEKTLSLRLR